MERVAPSCSDPSQTDFNPIITRFTVSPTIIEFGAGPLPSIDNYIDLMKS